MSKSAAPSIIANLNSEASVIATKIASNLKDFSSVAGVILEEHLTAQGLVELAADGTVDIFSSLVVGSAKLVSDSLYSGLKSGDGVLFNGLLAMGAVDMIDSMLEYRKAIDEKYPDLVDTILDASSFVLTTAAAIYAPGIAMVLKGTGVLDKIKDFISVETLESTSYLMHQKLDKIAEDKKLETIYNNADKIYDLAEITGANARGLCSISIEAEKIDNLIKLAEGSEKNKKFIKDMAEITELFPVTKEEVRKKLHFLEEDMVKLIDNSGVPKKDAELLKKDLAASMSAATKSLENLTKAATPFEKMVCAQEAAKNLEKLFDKAPKNKEINALKEGFNKLVKENIQGESAKLFNEAKKNPTIAKELGHSHKIDIVFEKLNAANMATNVSRAR
jgi:soluble cytochrome b562